MSKVKLFSLLALALVLAPALPVAAQGGGGGGGGGTGPGSPPNIPGTGSTTKCTGEGVGPEWGDTTECSTCNRPPETEEDDPKPPPSPPQPEPKAAPITPNKDIVTGAERGVCEPSEGAIVMTLPAEGLPSGGAVEGVWLPGPWKPGPVELDPREPPPDPRSEHGGGGGPPQLPPPSWFSYNSQVNLNRMTGNWWFPFDIFLVPQPNGDVRYYAPDAVGPAYVWDVVTQTYATPPGLFDVLVKNPDGTWTLTRKNGDKLHFNTSGYLVWVRSRYGLQTTINRGAPSQILSIDDYAGRRITISYYSNGYASTMTDWGGRIVSFTYDVSGNLTTISYPATTFYDRAAQTLVTRPRVLTLQYITGTGTSRDGNLTSILDDTGTPLFSNTYDMLDRAVSTTTTGGMWTYAYLADGTTKVVDPDGVTAIYSFNPAGAIIRKEVFTKSGLGQSALRAGEPASYVWLYERAHACGCDLITKITYPDGTTRTFTYDSWANMLSDAIDPPPGAGGSQIKHTWTYSTFGQFCRLLTHTLPEGYAAGNTPADHTVTRTYDPSGSVTQISYPKASINGVLQHPVVNYTVSAVGRMLTRTAPGGRLDTFEYAPGTYVLTQATYDVGGANATTSYVRDQFDRVTSVTNPRGFTTVYTYNALDQMTELAPPQPKGAKRTWLYDNNGRVYRIEVENKDSSGTVDSANPWFTTTTNYNANDLLVGVTSEIDASTTATTTFEYTAGRRVKKVIDPDGDVVEMQYDERGLVFKIIEAPGTAITGTTQVDYDLNGRPSRIVDPRGNATLSAYDHADRTTSVTFADSTTLAPTYDLDSNVIKVERADSGGIVRERTTWTFDPYGLRLTSSRHTLDAAGTTTQTDTTGYTYDSGLRLKTVADPLSNATSITWDALSRVSVLQDAATNKIELTYDANGNATVVKRFDWNQVTSAYDQLIFEHTYDALDRRTATTRRDPGNTLSSSTSAEYDGRGLLTKSIDELGNTIRHEWDARGLLTKTLRDLRAGGTGAGAITSTITNIFTYDLGGRTLTLQDGLSNATTYEYDARSRVKKVTNAAGQFATYTFDSNGNVATATDPNGSVVTSSYDAMDRLVSQSAAPGTGVLGDTLLGIAYDALGRPTQISDNDSTILRTYDSLGRLTSETQGPNPIGSNGKTFAFSYSAAGFNTGVTYPDTTIEQRNRDVIGRLSSVAIAGGSTLATYQYAGSRVPSLALPNNVTRTKSYDALLRNTLVEYKQNTTSQKKFEYLHNLADYRLLEKRHHAGGTGDNYDLDSIYRSVNVKAGVADPVAEYQNPGSQTVASTTGVTYDAAQSRSQVTVTVGGTPTTTNYTVDALNFYTAIGATVHVRDANGNLRDDGTNLYDYDYRNQLVRIRRKSDLAVIGTYEYDGSRRRIAKSTSAGTTSFYWIGFELAMEYDGSGLFSRRHRGAGFNEVVSAQQRDIADLDQDGSTTDYVPLTPLYDGAYDCIGMLDQSGAIAESYVHTYDGAVMITNAAGGAIPATAVGWRQGYGRLYLDTETGLLYAIHRYYNPATGRFANEDPLGPWYDRWNAGNSYGWLGNAYRQVVDPLGLGHERPSPRGGPVSSPTYVSDNANGSAAAGETLSLSSHVETLVSAMEDTDVSSTDGAYFDEALRELQDDEVFFYIVDIPQDQASDTNTNAYYRSTGWFFGLFNKNWAIVIDRTYWRSATNAQKKFTLLHELRHIGMAMARFCGSHHGTDPDDASTRMFNRRTFAYLDALRRALGLDPKEVSEVKTLKGID